MNDTIRLGRVAGIAIGVNWTVVAVGFLIAWSLAGRLLPAEVPGLAEPIYWLVAIGVAILFLGSLLAHELAHAVIARRNGLEVEGITLWLLGGVAKLRGEADSPGAEARIAAVGPLTSLVVAAVAWVVATLLLELRPTGVAALVTIGIQWLSVVNLVLAVFNLLPGAPLDGGRVARAVVWAIRGDRLTATRVASRLGRLLGYGLAVIGAAEIVIGEDIGGLWSIVLGFFLANAATSEQRQAEVIEALRGIRVADVMSTDPPRIPGTLTIDAFVEFVLPQAHASTWLVTELDGSPLGLLRAEDLGDRHRRPVGDERTAAAATPLDALPRTRSDELLVDLLGRLDADEAGPRVVVEDPWGRFVGLVLPEDVARALEAGRLRPRAGRGGGRAAGRGVREPRGW